ncbi:MAG: hypothetical protein O7H41_03655 [Planctomycetota bacterium]|nr:hypothetical protein [Planctomycetota bacterium]
MDFKAKADELRSEARGHLELAKRLELAASVLEGKDPTIRAGRVNQTDGRLGKIRAYIIDHGPSLRKDIVTGLGIPKGTMSMLLKEENGLVKLGNGLWDVEKASAGGSSKEP